MAKERREDAMRLVMENNQHCIDKHELLTITLLKGTSNGSDVQASSSKSNAMGSAVSNTV
jgi:hypothetical protein